MGSAMRHPPKIRHMMMTTITQPIPGRPSSGLQRAAPSAVYQKVLDQTPKKDILVVQGDWNAKIGEDAYENWIGTCGRYCNTKSNERGLRFLEFASYNDLMLANTFGPQKASRKATWHSRNGKYHNQIDYIMVMKRFRSSVNIAKTWSFPGADIGSDHELVMMTFKIHLERIKKLGHAWIKFELEKLKICIHCIVLCYCVV